MFDNESWFAETEEGKRPEPDSPEQKPDGFVARNPGSYAEFLRERSKGKPGKLTIRDPIWKAIFGIDEDKK